MKRTMKKMAAWICAVMMLVSMFGMTAFASEAQLQETPTSGSLTITKYKGDPENTNDPTGTTSDKPTSRDGDLLPGVTFRVLKVAEMEQETSQTQDPLTTTVELKYKWTLEDSTINTKFGTVVGTVYSADTLQSKVTALKTDSELNTFIDSVAGITENIFVEKTTGDGENGTSKGVAAFSDLPLGLYLVVETKAPANVTKKSVPFLVSIPMYTAANGQNPAWNYNVYAYPKNTTDDSTDIGKSITAVENGAASQEGNTAQASIGDIITYEVPVTVVIPDGGLEVLKVVDTIENGLDYVKSGNTVAVTVEKVESETASAVPVENYTVTSADKTDAAKATLTVNFMTEYLKTLTSSAEFKITYQAKLNADAVVGTAGNKNDVTLEYGRTGNTTTVPGTGTEDKPSPKVYTWGIQLEKLGESSAKLSDVEFTLQKKGADNAFANLGVVEKTAGTKGSYVVNADAANTNYTVTTGNDGTLVIRGLAEGTYQLTETKTANGYVLLKDPIVIEITADKNESNEYTGVATAKVNGKDATLVADGSSNSALVPVKVQNQKGFSLPSTGRAGIYASTIGGVVLLAAGVVLVLFFTRKKTNKAK